MKQIEVVAGIITDKDKIFCCQRGNKGPLALKWEFPGGKIEDGETHQEALKRELKEELDITVTVGSFLTTVMHQYPTFLLTMHCYYVDITEGTIELIEHIDSAWCDIEELSSFDWASADAPIVALLETSFIKYES